MNLAELEGLITDMAFKVRERQLRVNQALYTMGESGVELAARAIRTADREPVAAMAANFLGNLPGHDDLKNELVSEAAAERPGRLTALAGLIQDCSPETARRLLDFLAALPRPEEQSSAVFEIALHFPDLVRPHYQALKVCNIFEQVLPGAPDDWVKILVADYRANPHERLLYALGQVRTDSARAALIEISRGLDREGRDFCHALLEGAGVFPDSRLASTYPVSCRGYVVEAGRSPHGMGVPVAHRVPQCPVSLVTAECVLALDAGRLGLNLESPHAPRFFWYEGPDPPGSVYMVFSDLGARSLMTGDAEPEAHELFPRPLSLELVPRPTGRGRGGPAQPGFAQHQVGGFPHFIYPERFPRCPLCGQSMPFLASVDSGVTAVAALTFHGTLHGFWCDSCHVSCTVSQTLE